MPGFDLKQINRNDQGILGAGVLALIASLFFPFWGVSYHAGGIGYSNSVNAWHSYGVLGILFILIAAGIVAARVFANASLPKLPVGVNVLVLGLAGLGTLLLILRGFTYPHASGLGGSYGVKWGGYFLFIVGIAETAFAFLNFKVSGEKIAWDSSAIPKSTPSAGAPVPPAAPYGNAQPYGSAPAAPYGSAPAAPYGTSVAPEPGYTAPVDDTNPPA